LDKPHVTVFHLDYQPNFVVVKKKGGSVLRIKPGLAQNSVVLVWKTVRQRV